MDLGQFVDQLYAVLQNFGALSPLLKASAILTLLISAWKVSAFQWMWSQLGKFQSFMAPLLMTAAVIVQSLIKSGSVNWSSVGTAIVIGLTSIGFHELLCALKSFPGIGPLFVKVIDVVEAFLGGNGLNAVRIRNNSLVKLGLRKP
jgi:hypothetical protein